jgi:hypothetical protein
MPHHYELLHRGTGFKRRIELDERVGPQVPLFERRVHECLNPHVAYRQKAADVRLVIRDNFPLQIKNLHA